MKFKIDNQKQSEQLQNILFKMGFTLENNMVTVQRGQRMQQKFLYANTDFKLVYFGSDNGFFTHSHFKLMDTEQFILSHTEETLMTKPHKHAEIIKQWADGAQIEFFENVNNMWLSQQSPLWSEHLNYRVKPVPPEPVYPQSTLTDLLEEYQRIIGRGKGQHSTEENLTIFAALVIKEFITSGEMQKYIATK